MIEFALGWCACYLSWSLCDKRYTSAALAVLGIVYFGIAYIGKGATK